MSALDYSPSYFFNGLISIAVAVLLLCVLINIFNHLVFFLSRRQFTLVPAKVIHIVKSEDRFADMSLLIGAPGLNRKNRIKLVYEYQVDGRTYLGSKLDPSDTFLTPNTSLQFNNPFNVGEVIQVWMNNKHPRRSFLTLSFRRAVFGYLFFQLLALIAIGFYCFKNSFLLSLF
jgi:hypothetical protein